MKQEDYDKLIEANKKADELFAANNKGNDEADPVFYEERIQFKEIPDTTVFSNSPGGDKLPEAKILIISKHAIGILSETVSNLFI